MDDHIYSDFDFMEQLPVIRDLTICRNVSAHDKRGGNDNGFTNKAEFIRKEKGRGAVYLDMVGPGCVRHFAAFWLNHPRFTPRFVERAQARLLGRIKFFFDGENLPRIRTPLKNFIGQAPFIPPLAFTAEQSAYAYVSYVSMPFQDSLRVSVSGGRMPLFGLHFWCHCYPHGTKVPTWSEGQDITWAASHFNPEAAWRPAGPAIHEVNDLIIRPGETREIFKSSQGGTIKCIRMMLPHDDTALRSLWLKAWWDEDKEPSLEGPLSLFFAVENRFKSATAWLAKRWHIDEHAEMRGVIIGQDRDGLFFLRLPMPYARSARLVIENRGVNSGDTLLIPGTPYLIRGELSKVSPELIKIGVPGIVHIAKLKIEVDDRLQPGLGKSAGYLRTQFRELGAIHESPLPPGRDYLLADVKGRGHIAGTVLAVEDTHENFLEGDERIYTDGCRSPLVIGDATETYFNGSWYFCEQAFACPIHGAPTFRMKSKWGGDISDVTMYRFHPTDFIPFRAGARFSIQHGGFNEVPGNYRSLVFYYSLPDKSLFRTDFLSMDDSSDLDAHRFSGARAVRTWVRDGFFEGDYNGQDLGTRKRPKWVLPIWWMLYLTFIVGNRHNPPENSPDKVSFTVAEHDRPYQFTVKIDPKADAVMLRRVLDQSVRDQRAKIEVDGKLAGIWFNTGNNKWKIFAEDDLILDPSLTRGKEEITIRVTPESPIFTAAEYTVFSIITQ